MLLSLNLKAVISHMDIYRCVSKTLICILRIIQFINFSPNSHLLVFTLLLSAHNIFLSWESKVKLFVWKLEGKNLHKINCLLNVYMKQITPIVLAQQIFILIQFDVNSAK